MEYEVLVLGPGQIGISTRALRQYAYAIGKKLEEINPYYLKLALTSPEMTIISDKTGAVVCRRADLFFKGQHHPNGAVEINEVKRGAKKYFDRLNRGRQNNRRFLRSTCRSFELLPDEE